MILCHELAPVRRNPPFNPIALLKPSTRLRDASVRCMFTRSPSLCSALDLVACVTSM
eukprot:CAMPEP_0181031558 /NCGR_PEP_ID=MMETSP1070-20121207/6294_1 /TAXON_ID=265543 /ORGANISM="Minutocellus polymorphus, Strain NH13" /LENGTH=56 /DNA_ID=CAMNT_0023108939 /DNA_START=182 /DNA_END=349 /DNA_ORIENTATION=+